jgi:hypothetical protein
LPRSIVCGGPGVGVRMQSYPSQDGLVSVRILVGKGHRVPGDLSEGGES